MQTPVPGFYTTLSWGSRALSRSPESQGCQKKNRFPWSWLSMFSWCLMMIKRRNLDNGEQQCELFVDRRGDLNKTLPLGKYPANVLCLLSYDMIWLVWLVCYAIIQLYNQCHNHLAWPSSTSPAIPPLLRLANALDRDDDDDDDGEDISGVRRIYPRRIYV